MMRWKGRRRCGWRRWRWKMINARGGRRTENRRRGRHTTVDLVQCSRHFGKILMFLIKQKKRTTKQVEEKGSHGSMSITHGQQQQLRKLSCCCCCCRKDGPSHRRLFLFFFFCYLSIGRNSSTALGTCWAKKKKTTVFFIRVKKKKIL